MLFECLNEENIVRAILSSHWDQKHERFSSDLFRGPGISVSRLVILSLEKLFEIFHKELDRLNLSPQNIVEWAGEINVGLLKDIGLNHKKNPTEITVISMPTDSNPAHAEIPQKLSKGLAKSIIKALKIHKN
ncbi:MAG: hypothetical protein ACYC6G_14560 [Desulfobaccales bacterium]